MSVEVGHSQKASKTVDIGFQGVSLSTDPLGTILQISTFHPKHGIILAEPYEQFDGTRFRDTPYVREYRARMLRSIQKGDPGFGVRFNVEGQNLAINLEGLGRASVVYETTTGLQITTSVCVSDDGEVIQSSKITSTDSLATQVEYTMDLGISVNRASYGQLTEGGPIPIPKSENAIEPVEGGAGFGIVNTHLGAHLAGHLEENGKVVDISTGIRKQIFENSPVKGAIARVVEIPPKSSVTVTAVFCLRPGVGYGTSIDHDRTSRMTGVSAIWPKPESPGRLIVRRNLEYILGNCAIPLSPSKNAICILTDHVALPLGWMRDNYWQVRFLLDSYKNLDSLAGAEARATYSQLIKDTAKGHLNWIFRYAQRPHKFWHRSYLTTGRPKDGPVFQLDQQCYPLLEICDFLDVFPDERVFIDSVIADDTIPQILDLIESKKDKTTGLFATDETPGDDEVEYPYHFSSHILLWYTTSRLAHVASKFPGRSQLSERLRDLANTVRISTMKHFLSSPSQQHGPLFAYLVDGQGGRTFYHDANDIPTLFALDWGFVRSTEEQEAWHNTIQFGFSEANDGGYYSNGPFGGLGSVHTRGPWTLGYFQGWRYAQMTGDLQGESAAWQKILGAMLWDGTFSEAVDAQTGECTSKAWFSWPGSMIGSGLLLTGNRERYM